MMSTSNGSGALMERVVAVGDLDGLQPMERAKYYARVCESMGLNPLTKPFAYIRLNGKLTLYALRDAADQLRKIHAVSVVIAKRETVQDIHVVTARAQMPDGRTDESTGAVSVGGLKGESLANALMKAETKAKRRVTLSICGLGWLDETEVSDVRAAKPVTVTDDGEIVDSQPLAKQLAASVDWGKWAGDHLGAMRNAQDRGQLNEVLLDVARDIERLQPPPDVVTELRASVAEVKASKGWK